MKIGFNHILNRPAGVLLLFTVLTVTLRFFSFFPSVLDHDESTYLEIAREMLNGKVLYVDLIDIKPPGIFLIYAFFQLVFGHSIFVIRLLTAVWIALTSFVIYKTGHLIYQNKHVAIAGGLIYIFFVSCWSDYGISPNTEIFFNLFTISALYLFLKRDHWLNFIGAGLLLGTGFIIKYVVLFDYAAILLFFLLRFFKQPSRPDFLRLVTKCFLSAAGFLMPFAVLNVYYYLTGNFGAFADIVYFAVVRYPKEIIPLPMLKFVLDFFLFFSPIQFFYFYSLFDSSLQDQKGKDFRLLSVIWLIMVLIGIVLPGNRFDHYFIQLMLPISLQAATFFHSGIKHPVLLARLTRGIIGMIILFMLCMVILFFSYRDSFQKADTPCQIAEYLKPRLKHKDMIYTGNYHQIIYYLLEKDSPTPYVHRTLLVSPTHLDALRIDLVKESQHIIDQRPAYIIIQGRYNNERINQFIRDHYVVERQFEKDILLYRLDDDHSRLMP